MYIWPDAEAQRGDVPSHLDLAHGTGDDGLDDRAAVVVQQVDLVDDEQAHELRVGAVAALARDDVPLLRRGHNDLGGIDLALGHVHVTCQLPNLQAKAPFRESPWIKQCMPVPHHDHAEELSMAALQGMP